jgi:hypothetical protein
MPPRPVYERAPDIDVPDNLGEDGHSRAGRPGATGFAGTVTVAPARGLCAPGTAHGRVPLATGRGDADLALAPRYGPPHVSRSSSAPQPSSTAKDSRESHADRAPVRQDAAPLPTRAALQLAPLLSQAAAGLTCDAVGMLRPQVAGQEWQHSVLKPARGRLLPFHHSPRIHFLCTLAAK